MTQFVTLLAVNLDGTPGVLGAQTLNIDRIDSLHVEKRQSAHVVVVKPFGEYYFAPFGASAPDLQRRRALLGDRLLPTDFPLPGSADAPLFSPEQD